MSYYAALNAVAGSIRYFVGGVIGNISIPAVFVIQIAALLSTALLALIFIKDPDYSCESHEFKNITFAANQSNGLKSITTNSLLIILVIVFLSTFAPHSYDNSLNYHIKAGLDLTPIYNGIMKAVTGIIGLVVNFTINISIVKKQI